ncbi:MAG: Gfo/Idh/MocA family oxidoreductase [Actinomycetota bacterium]
MSGVLRVGVVGLGVMGRAHLRVLRSLAGVEVVAVADVAPGALVGVGPATTYDDPLALVGSADVDAVLVASSDATHAELVLACLERGLPVLCEKPLTTSVRDTMAILAAESVSGRRLVQVGFMRRFDPAFAAVHDAVRAGAVGAPAVIHTVHRNPVSSYPFTPAVLVTSSASHDVDLVRWITGEEIALVSATPAPAPDVRFASVLLRLTTTGGVLASTELTYGPSCAYDVRCEVVGRTGSVATPPDEGGDGAWVHRFDEAYRRQDAAWVASVRGDPVGAGVLDGLANAVVLAGAEQSLATGQPVSVGPVPQRPV